MPHDLESVLSRSFGHASFRPGQEQVIGALLAGRSALALFPTGAGKSLCYQLPSLLLDGLTVVISPLIALMKDQVEALEARGIAAARLDSSLTPAETAAVHERIRTGSLRLLYIAPERLTSEQFVGRLSRARVALMALDEAHCISEWGLSLQPAEDPGELRAGDGPRGPRRCARRLRAAGLRRRPHPAREFHLRRHAHAGGAAPAPGRAVRAGGFRSLPTIGAAAGRVRPLALRARTGDRHPPAGDRDGAHPPGARRDHPATGIVLCRLSVSVARAGGGTPGATHARPRRAHALAAGALRHARGPRSRAAPGRPRLRRGPRLPDAQAPEVFRRGFRRGRRPGGERRIARSLRHLHEL